MKIFLSLLILIAIQLSAGIGVGYSGTSPLRVELTTFSAMISETLEQNFPNPFNPTTIIECGVGSRENEVSSKQNVVLKIYDVLGREIETLVNEQKTADKYSGVFDATKYPAGIYCNEVRACEYRSIKKMLHI